MKIERPLSIDVWYIVLLGYHYWWILFWLAAFLQIIVNRISDRVSFRRLIVRLINKEENVCCEPNFAYRTLICKATNSHSSQTNIVEHTISFPNVVECNIKRDPSWGDMSQIYQMRHHLCIGSENMSLKRHCGWQLTMHLFFFFFCRDEVQVVKRSSFTYNRFRRQAGSQKRFYTEIHEWACLTAGMCFCPARGGRKRHGLEPRVPTVSFFRLLLPRIYINILTRMTGNIRNKL